MFSTVGIRDFTCEHGGLIVRHHCASCLMECEEVTSSVRLTFLVANGWVLGE